MTFFQPGAEPDDHSQKCPICGAGQPASARFPRYVCEECVEIARDAEGRRVEFFNEGPFGGVVVRVMETEEELAEHKCWIDGRECSVMEGKFGGIVVQPLA